MELDFSNLKAYFVVTIHFLIDGCLVSFVKSYKFKAGSYENILNFQTRK